MDFEQARQNMIRQQIRTYDVLDDRVLGEIERVRREDFVPAAQKALAFADLYLPIGRGEVMLPPKLEARVLQSLELMEHDRVLEVGTGSGYFTALLAGLAGAVFSVEILPEFKMAAQTRLAAHNITNVTLDVGDGVRGWGRHGPYDVIVLTGSVSTIDPAFLESLAPGGRLVAFVGRGEAMELKRIRRLADGLGSEEQSLFDAYAPPLRGSEPPPSFRF